MAKDLKSNVFSNFLWKFAERLGSQLVTFTVSLVLAWFIDPDSYSVITIVTIIITLCNLFVTSGFGNSLVQKKDADNVDFSTVLWFSLAGAGVVYGLLFIAAPFCETFFSIPLLCPVVRIMGLRLFISAFNSVQEAYVARTMQFRRFFFSTLGGTVVSGAVGILMAMRGFGVWSVVTQYLVMSAVSTLVLWFTVDWRPETRFSFSRLKGLLSFGWKVLASGMLDEIYNNMRFFIVGKICPGDRVSVYNNGQRIPNLIVDNVNSSLYSVLFPAFSRSQHDIEKVREMTRRSIRTCLYVMMPLMVGIAVCAEPIVMLILPESWHGCIPFIRISAIMYSVVPLQTANMQSVKAIGRSDVTLVLEVIKKALGFSFLFVIVAVKDSISDVTMAIALVTMGASFLFALINTVPNKLYLGYRFRDQIADVLPVTLICALMGGAAWAVGLLPIPTVLSLVLQVTVGIAVYLFLSVITKNDSFRFLLDFLKGLKSRGDMTEKE